MACSQSDGTKEKDTRVDKTDESGSDDNDKTDDLEEDTETDNLMTPYGKYPEEIELHIVKKTSVEPNFVEGDTVEDNVMTRYIHDKLNIKTIVDWEVDASEYVNKLSLMLTSGSLPDMFVLSPNDYLLYRQLLENDMLADLTESYEKCAGPYMKEVFESYDHKNLEPYMEDGKLYGIAGGNIGYQHNLLWLRKDWLDKYDLELPESIDDIKNILTVFKEKNPGGKHVGMLLNATDPVGGYGTGYAATPIFGACGATPKTWIRDKNNEIVYGSVMPEMKEGLKILADWYAEGLIDEQFPTRTDDDANKALWNNGQSGVRFSPWWHASSMTELPKNDPEAEIIPVNAPLDEQGNYNVVGPNPSGDVVFINKEYPYPEVAVKILNVEYDMWREFDPEAAELIKPSKDANVDWSYMFPTGALNIEYYDIVPKVGLLAKNYIEEGKMEGYDNATGHDKKMVEDAKHYADTKDYEHIGWVHYHGRYLASNIVDAPEVKITLPEFSLTTESMADLKPNLDTLEETAFLEIILGEKPIDYFDEFVEEWYEQGGDIITEEVRSLVD